MRVTRIKDVVTGQVVSQMVAGDPEPGESKAEILAELLRQLEAPLAFAIKADRLTNDRRFTNIVVALRTAIEAVETQRVHYQQQEAPDVR